MFSNTCSLKEIGPWFIAESCLGGIKGGNEVVMETIKHHDSMASFHLLSPIAHMNLLHSYVVGNMNLWHSVADHLKEMSYDSRDPENKYILTCKSENASPSPEMKQPLPTTI